MKSDKGKKTYRFKHIGIVRNDEYLAPFEEAIKRLQYEYEKQKNDNFVSYKKHKSKKRKRIINIMHTFLKNTKSKPNFSYIIFSSCNPTTGKITRTYCSSYFFFYKVGFTPPYNFIINKVLKENIEVRNRIV